MFYAGQKTCSWVRYDLLTISGLLRMLMAFPKHGGSLS